MTWPLLLSHAHYTNNAVVNRNVPPPQTAKTFTQTEPLADTELDRAVAKIEGTKFQITQLPQASFRRGGDAFAPTPQSPGKSPQLGKWT
jgi:hypothetical protein